MAVIDPTTTAQKAGWYTDPEGRHYLRYFDGNAWTEHVTHFGPTPCSGCAIEPAATDPVDDL